MRVFSKSFMDGRNRFCQMLNWGSDAFQVDVDKRQPICPQGKLSTQCSRITDSYMGTEYYRIEWGISVVAVLYKKTVRVPRVDGELQWLDCATIWCSSVAEK